MRIVWSLLLAGLITTYAVSQDNTNTLTNTDMASTNSSPASPSPAGQPRYPHMVGIHVGMTTSSGLCYRYYPSSSFAWQIEFLPYVINEDNSLFGASFISVGTMMQWFFPALTNQSPLFGFKTFTRFFFWTGGYGTWHADNALDGGIGGGIGFEESGEHIVFSIASGYYLRYSTLSPRWEINSQYGMPTITLEGTIGFRF